MNEYMAIRSAKTPKPPAANATVTAADLGKQFEKSAAKAARKAAKSATNDALQVAKRSKDNTPVGRPGGATSNVNIGKPQMLRLSGMIRALGGQSWTGYELERDFGQATKALFGSDFEASSMALPSTRTAFGQVVTEAQINVGQPKALREWAARGSDFEQSALERMQKGDIAGARQALRDAAEATTGAGGALVPPEYMQNLYTLSLQTAVAFGNAPGVTRIPVNSNLIYFPRETVMPTSDVYGEAAILSPTDPTFGQQAITIKKQAGLNRFSNELLADATPEYEQVIGKSLARSVGLKQDFEYLEGDGTGAHVLGLRHYPGTTAGQTYSDEGMAWGRATTPATGTPIGPGVIGPMLMLADARAAGWEPNAFIMHSDVMNKALALCVDSTGRFLLESIGGVFGAPIPIPNIGALPTQITYVTPPWKAMLLGCPVFMTSQIPQNETYGDSADTTHVFTGDFNFAHILERSALELARADQIYFTTDQTAVRMTARSAIVLLAPAAFMVQLGVRATTVDTNE